MNRQTRRAAGNRQPQLSAPSCTHCGTTRVVLPLASMRVLARKFPELVDLLGALEQMREFYDEHDLVALCPGCFCLTGDPQEMHSH